MWRVVLIDDYLPVTEDGELAYSWALHGQLWVSLLEKAYAKLHKSYAAISLGRMRDALADLTGAPCCSIELNNPKDSDLVWARMLSFRGNTSHIHAHPGIAHLGTPIDLG